MALTTDAEAKGSGKLVKELLDQCALSHPRWTAEDNRAEIVVIAAAAAHCASDESRRDVRPSKGGGNRRLAGRAKPHDDHSQRQDATRLRIQKKAASKKQRPAHRYSNSSTFMLVMVQLCLDTADLP